MKNYQLPKTSDFYQKLDNTTNLFEQRAATLLGGAARAYAAEIANRRSTVDRGKLTTDAGDITEGEAILELLVFRVLAEKYCAGGGYMNSDELPELLEATGEYREIAKRMRDLSVFLSAYPDKAQLYKVSTEVMNYMMSLGETHFGELFANVNAFADEKESERPVRGDIALVARRSNEYYLNLFGAQMLNRIYEEAFRATDEKYVFLPGCMAAQGDKCQAADAAIGYTCAGCTKECMVNHITQAMKKDAVKVTLFYHGSQINSALVKEGTSKGLIGVACIPNLLEGGYQAKRLGFVPQCVFLNFGGCKQHWNPDGCVTECNEGRIEQMICR